MDVIADAVPEPLPDAPAGVETTTLLAVPVIVETREPALLIASGRTRVAAPLGSVEPYTVVVLLTPTGMMMVICGHSVGAMVVSE